MSSVAQTPFCVWGVAIMGACWSKITCGRDPDTFFAYNTVRVTQVRDRRLGALYYFLVFLVRPLFFHFASQSLSIHTFEILVKSVIDGSTFASPQICIYIVGYVLVFKKSYLRLTSPTGTLRWSLLQPNATVVNIHDPDQLP